MKYTRNLKFEEKPDYVWIRRLFKELFFRCEFKFDLIFEWALTSTEEVNFNNKDSKKITVPLYSDRMLNMMKQNKSSFKQKNMKVLNTITDNIYI
jgi:hypothetical protein